MKYAGLAWLLGLLIITIYEFWALASHGVTLSEWVWTFSDNHSWFRWVVTGGLLVLIYHFFFRVR